MNPIPCSVCSESGHHARRCPQLSAPLQPGFFTPSGGGGHSHDEDDEKLKTIVCLCLSNTMVYIGYPVYYNEALRLFKPQLHLHGYKEDDEQKAGNYPHFNIIEKYLHLFTSLRIHWIDKGIYIIGFKLSDIDQRYWKPLLSADDAAIAILQAKKRFKEEVKAIQLNTSVIEFAYMEEGEETVYNPEPAVFF